MQIKKIAILTSGGDAPGMNSTVRAIVNSSINFGMETFVVYEGYKGLTEGNIKVVKRSEVDEVLEKGGTYIYSARYPEFKEESTRKKGIDQLNKLGIEALIVIGGDGTYMGAKLLSDMGVKTIAIPGTIDNDISLTDITLGYTTAINTAAEAISKVRDTHESHNRAGIVEVMGRYCGDLAINAAIASGAEVLSIPERELTKDQIAEQIKKHRDSGKRSIIAVVTENMYDIQELAKYVEKKTNIETKGTTLGHIQRGGEPNVTDRILGVRMGTFAVKKILQGRTGVAVSLKNDKLESIDITKVVEHEREVPTQLLEQYDASN